MPSAAPARSPRSALLALQLGALAVVLAALPFRAFELDRFFVPKELALHLSAAGTAVLALGAGEGGVTSRRRLADWALVGFLALGVASAVGATNHWLAARALGVSLSGAVVFWAARALARAGRAAPLLVALAAAVALGALTSLAQAYGADSDYFSINRAPGGTFGNRNFVAHVAAIGLPVAVYCALVARRAGGALVGAVATGAIAAALVLTRSRAAWLAVGAGLVPAVAAILRARALAADPRVAGRRRLIVLASGVGVLCALVLPNTLHWRSDSPYLDSVRGVVDYRQGSGRGRLVQYENTLEMALDHPLLGVGPGNWSVWYPRYSSRRDPSLGDDGMTSNPWPSSDWAALLAERGVAATALFMLVFLAAAANAVRALVRARTAEDTLAPAALGSVVVATLVVGAFDAVLLLAAPTFITWAALGALWPEESAGGREGSSSRRRTPSSVGSSSPRAARLGEVVAVLTLFLAARSGLQALAMWLAEDGRRRAAIERAAVVDPGSYRLQIWLARGDARRGSCRAVREHAGAATELFPSAPEPRRLLARCGVTTRAATAPAAPGLGSGVSALARR